MTDSPALDLPISSGLTRFLDAQLAAIQANILGSEDRNLAQNIDALYATMRQVIAAVAALESDIDGLRAAG